MRKAPHVFGWDIMPRAVSAGIWRPVRLEFLPAARLDTVGLETTAADDREAKLTLHFRARVPPGPFDASSDRPLAGWEVALAGDRGDSHFEARTPLHFEAGRISFAVKDPRRWWPRDRVTATGAVADLRCASFRRDDRQLVSQLMNRSGSGKFVTLGYSQKQVEPMVPAITIPTGVWSDRAWHRAIWRPWSERSLASEGDFAGTVNESKVELIETIRGAVGGCTL